MPNNILYDSQGDFAGTKFMEYLIISVYFNVHERCLNHCTLNYPATIPLPTLHEDSHFIGCRVHKAVAA
ncbi:hypothetical protein Phpb_01391 [Photorhabdus namnaonensis]|uniref:Uncharacterized protein n=2 Tax=Photorhabdus namnaonensis TaxID=1851568 RepID=A0A1B8YKC0_9GAMM|nr:hypothetical protein Phpb_01391 [Photorhabdus namnaonensis]